MHTCYISYNTSEDIGYVGYELGDGNTHYYGSSDSPSFLFAKRNGQLRKYILGNFEKELEARVAEKFSIKKLREGGMNLYNRNVGGGGKDGPLDDYRLITDEFRVTLDQICSDRVFPENKSKPDARRLAEAILQKIKNKEYEIFEESLEKISKYDFIQVRVIRHVKSHIRDLVDKMTENSSLFREKTDPLIVVVDDRDTKNIKRSVIGGNHRVAAAVQIGWTTFPTVYINYAELDYDEFNRIHLGERDNFKNLIIEKQMDEIDIKKMIQNFHDRNPELHPSSYEFKEAFIHTYGGGNFSDQKLRSNLKSYSEKYNENELASKYNFHQYDERELRSIKDSLSAKKEFDDAVIISDNVVTLMNNGLGGILNSLGSSQNVASVYGRVAKKTGLIFARYTKPSEVGSGDDCILQFSNAIKIAGFDHKGDMTWTNKDGYVIKILILPYIHESDSHPVTWKSFEKAVSTLLEKVNIAKTAA